MATRRPNPARALIALLAGSALGLALPARSAVWETHNNANALNAVTATASVVWCPSDLGLHRYDPVSGRFTRVAKAPGQLASNSVAVVAVDGDGNTWFATRDRGVSVQTRQGGWRTLSVFDGVPTDSVSALLPSGVGVWVGTTQGLALFDNFQLTAVWPDGVNPSPFASDVINALAEVGDSTWVGTNDGAYVTRTTEGLTWSRRVNGLAGTRINALAALGTTAWCVAGNRIYRGGETGAWTLAESGLPGGTSSFSLRGRGSDLVAGTSNGVFQWNGAAWQSVGGPAQARVELDPSGGMWAGTSDGLWRREGGGWAQLRSPGPGGNWVQGMALQGSRLYIATRDQGVARYDGTSWRTFSPQPGASPDTTLLSGDFVFGMLVDAQGDKWAGDWGNSLARIDDTTDPPTVEHYYDASEGAFDARNTYVWSSAIDGAGNRWFGLDTALLGVITPLGINRIGIDDSRTNFNPQSGAALSGPQIRAIAFAPGPGFEMWVGIARSGVDIFTDPTLTTRSGHLSTVEGLLSDDVWGIQFFGDSVWVATANGLTRFSRATRLQQERIGTQPPSSQGAVHPLTVDAGGGVWWATGAGVLHRRTDRSVEIYTTDNSPLLSNDVHSVIADPASGAIWIGTVFGVNRLDPGASAGGGASGPATFAVAPNPAFLSAAGLVLRSPDLAGPFVGRVFDVRGRIVRHLLGNATSGSLWDGRDEGGVLVRPGLYLFEITQNQVTRRGRVFLVR